MSNASCFQKSMKSVPVCVCLPYALCLYLTCTWHTHTHTQTSASFLVFFPCFSMSLSTSSSLYPVHPSLFQSTTLSLPSLGCCVFSLNFSSALTFLSSVGVCACFPPLFSVSPPLSHMGRTLSTLSCADLYDSSIIVLRTC